MNAFVDLPSYVDRFTDRDVSIIDASWTDMPIQVYSGKQLQAARDRHYFYNDNDEMNKNLSKSSESLLEQPLTDDEQQRLKSKILAEARASRLLCPEEHLHILYADAHICVVHKPSGVLCVPGPRRNPSVANLVYDALRPHSIDIDQMVVHRLDMDTSGIVLFALTKNSLQQLHEDFRDHRVQKTYHALLCGHLVASEGEIDLPLERDPTRPPFMRVSLQGRVGKEQNQTFERFAKHINKAPKCSLTDFRVISRGYLQHQDGKVPVTRVELKPKTGRTHQLRVHCAAIGHPIVGDDIYGLGGEGSGEGGLEPAQCEQFLGRASLDLQLRLFEMKLNLCLHAKRLCIHHPLTGAPMVFQAESNF